MAYLIAVIGGFALAAISLFCGTIGITIALSIVAVLLILLFIMLLIHLIVGDK